MHPIRPNLAAPASPARRPTLPPASPVPATPQPSRSVSPPPGSPPPEFFHDGFLRGLEAPPTPPGSPPPEFLQPGFLRGLEAPMTPPASPPPEFLQPGFLRGLEGPPTPPVSPPAEFLRDGFAREAGAPSPRDWFRPDSPTYRALQDNADMEHLLGSTQAPSRPAGIRPMTADESDAAAWFRAGIDALDPGGTLRHAGEFGQTFHHDGRGIVPSIPMRYQRGTTIDFPPGAVGPRTAQVIHSHPGPPALHGPSDADYLAAYGSTRGNAGPMLGEMVYHPGLDRFFAYEPRINPATGLPSYLELAETPFNLPPPAGRKKEAP